MRNLEISFHCASVTMMIIDEKNIETFAQFKLFFFGWFISQISYHFIANAYE